MLTVHNNDVIRRRQSLTARPAKTACRQQPFSKPLLRFPFFHLLFCENTVFCNIKILRLQNWLFLQFNFYRLEFGTVKLVEFDQFKILLTRKIICNTSCNRPCNSVLTLYKHACVIGIVNKCNLHKCGRH